MTVKFCDDPAPKLHAAIKGAASNTAGRTQNAHVSAESDSVTMKIAELMSLVKESEEFHKRIPQINRTEDEKRTDTWFQRLGLQSPLDKTMYSSIGSIGYENGDVKIHSAPWEEVRPEARET